MAAGMEQRFELRDPREPWRLVRGCMRLPAGGVGAPLVLVLHGFKGFMDWGFFPLLAERLVARGMAVARFNGSCSGIGADGETFTELECFRRGTFSRELQDVERVRAWADHGLEPRRRAILGHSRGGGMALVHASEVGDYDAVVTWAAVDRFGPRDEATLAAWRREGVLRIPNLRTGQILEVDVEVLEDLERHRDRFDVLAACRRLRAPLLAIHGSADEAVDPGALRRIADAAGGDDVRTILLASAGHTFGAAHPLAMVTPELEQVLRETEAFLSGRLLDTTA